MLFLNLEEEPAICVDRKATDSKVIDSFSARNVYHCYNYLKHQGALLDIKICTIVISLKCNYYVDVYMQN